ncbi:alpha/beta fold hydrolase [Leisingera sp. ANG-Vp]|uniref:alpha/beta fold hydrolase n=1 Tax=Leisingera sp. ANG-Vp TaxID=1577896 RepID=UPI0005803DEA|nr:alpha/beta hydrolase [Leisingera sp. ANG-Vp]KIC15211.1 alpha/beta hydrolase [Leisingera sp. ANG-Vp]
MPNLPYLRAGKGPVLVLVHGYLGGAAQWKKEIEAFSRDFDVIAPNLPGFGDAGGLEGCETINGMAQSVLALLDHLGVEEFILMGHSMGGMIAQEMAALRTASVQKLVLYGTGPLGLMPDRFEPITVSRERLQADGVAKTIERIGATWFKAGSKAKGYPLLTDIGAQANPQAALAALGAMAGWDGRAALSRLTMPTLVVWGDSDKSYRWPQVESLWTNLPNVCLSVVPGAAHAVHLEKPSLFHTLLSDFLGEN